MGKTKTSVKRKPSTRSIRNKKIPRKIRRGMGVERYDPTIALLDEERVGRVIWECLKNGDSEGVIEVIQIHLEAYTEYQN